MIRMPPKSARGRKKATASEVVQNGKETKMRSEDINANDQDLSPNNFNKMTEKKANKNADIDAPAGDKNSNGHLQNLNKASETVEKIACNSDNSNDTNVLVCDNLEEMENPEEIANGGIKNGKNLNGKVAPLKRGRKKADVPAKNVEVPTEAVESIPLVDENNKESLAQQNLKIATTESNTPGESRSEFINDNNKTEPDTKVEISDDNKEAELDNKVEISDDNNKTEPDTKAEISVDKNKHEEKKVPLKRGRPKRVVENTSNKQLQAEERVPSGRGQRKIKDEPDENAQNKQLQAEEKVPSKRGRKKANPLNPDESSDSKKMDIKEEPSNGSPSEELQTEEKLPSKRGRKKANVPSISDKSSNLKKIKEELNEEESSNTKEQKSDVNIPSKRGRRKAIQNDTAQDSEEQKGDVNVPNEELNLPSKRGRRKIIQKDTAQGFGNEEYNVDSCETSQDVVKKEISDEITKISVKEEEPEASSQIKELPSVGRKRKNEMPTEDIDENKQGFNETKILKVALQRDETIDKMNEEQTKIPKKGGTKNAKLFKMNEEESKITKKGGTKNAKAGGKRTKEVDVDSKESGEKSPKMPKGESNSKGQSKKDKMPDVTLIDFGNNSTSPSGKPWNLKISSWNVNGVRAWLEKDGLAYVAHENPDIVTFQETKCSDKMLPKEVNIAGYHSYWLAGDKDGYSGVGLLSKKEPVSVNYGIGVKEHDNEGRVITAEYETFYLVTAYVPNAGRKLVRLDYRMQWDKDFRSYIKNLDEKKPVVLCGDLNVAHEEIDLANPKNNKKNAGFTKEEREGFSALLSEGFIDSFRHLYPDKEGAYTFWTYMMNSRAKDVGWRLDYFVLSNKLTDHLCDNVIRKDVFGSDHCPITLFLSV